MEKPGYSCIRRNMKINGKNTNVLSFCLRNRMWMERGWGQEANIISRSSSFLKLCTCFFFFFEKYEYQENNFFKINLTCAFLAVTSPYSVLFFTFMLFLLSDSKTFWENIYGMLPSNEIMWSFIGKVCQQMLPHQRWFAVSFIYLEVILN